MGDNNIEWAEAYTISAKEARELARSGEGDPFECVPIPPNRVSGRYHNLKSTYMDNFRGDFVAPERPPKKKQTIEPRPFIGTTTHQVTNRICSLELSIQMRR